MRIRIQIPAARLAALAAGFLSLFAGCTPNVITGTVTDIRGEALPGVAVQIVGKERQALTNPRGEYKLRYAQADKLSLAFFKTGYTPGLLEMPADGASAKQATPVALWPLPNANGVYLYENNEYVRTRPVEPEKYVTDATGTVYGILALSDVGTMNTEPLILCYKMPKYGAHLYRLANLDGRLADSGPEGDTLSVWVPAREIPIAYTAIDEPDGQLMQVQPLQPLDPDYSYIVEFGVVSGENVRETRMFNFNIFSSMISAAPDETKTEEEPAEPKPKATEEEPDSEATTTDDSGGF